MTVAVVVALVSLVSFPASGLAVLLGALSAFPYACFALLSLVGFASAMVALLREDLHE